MWLDRWNVFSLLVTKTRNALSLMDKVPGVFTIRFQIWSAAWWRGQKWYGELQQNTKNRGSVCVCGQGHIQDIAYTPLCTGRFDTKGHFYFTTHKLVNNQRRKINRQIIIRKYIYFKIQGKASRCAQCEHLQLIDECRQYMSFFQS